MPGERIDGYRVGELLGGMARLYPVTHPRRRGSLVMKVPKLGPGSPLSATAAFEQERQILARLHGRMSRGSWPWAIRDGGRIWSWNTSRATRWRYKRAERRCRGQVRDLGVRLCRAVPGLHRQNVIHLDLNPGNVRDRAAAQVLGGFRWRTTRRCRMASTARSARKGRDDTLHCARTGCGM